MITLQQFGIRLTALLDDLTEAAFAALAWIEEDDRQPAGGLAQAGVRALRKSAPRPHSKSKTRRQPQWSGSPARWMM
jgi:hypothetical protein